MPQTPTPENPDEGSTDDGDSTGSSRSRYDYRAPDFLSKYASPALSRDEDDEDDHSPSASDDATSRVDSWSGDRSEAYDPDASGSFADSVLSRTEIPNIEVPDLGDLEAEIARYDGAGRDATDRDASGRDGTDRGADGRSGTVRAASGGDDDTGEIDRDASEHVDDDSSPFDNPKAFARSTRRSARLRRARERSKETARRQAIRAISPAGTTVTETTPPGATTPTYQTDTVLPGSLADRLQRMSEKADDSTTTKQKRTKGDTSTTALIAAVCALLVAGIAAPLAWTLAIGAGILAIVALFKRTTGARVRAIIALVIVGILGVGQLAAVPGDSDSGGDDSESAPSEQSATEHGTGENWFYAGSGDEEVEVALPDGEGTMAVLEVVGRDGADVDVEQVFANDATRYLTSTSSSGTPLGIMNGDPERSSSRLSVEADGDWTITARSLSSLESFDSQFEGAAGETAVVYTGPAGVADFTLSGDGRSSITSHGHEDPWQFYEYDLFGVAKGVGDGPVVLLVDAEGPWSVEVVPDPAVASPPATPTATSSTPPSS